VADRLREILNGYRHDVLQRLAESGGLTPEAKGGRRLTKGDLIRLVHSHLLSRDRLSLALSSLSDVERAVLDRVLLHPGDLPIAVLRDELQRLEVVEPGPRKGKSDSYEGNPFSPSRNYLEDVLARLTLRGLVFSRGPRVTALPSSRLGFGPGLVLTIPEPLRSHLPKPAMPGVEWGRGNLPAAVEESSTRIAQRDLFIYWSYLRHEPAPLTQAGLMQRRAFRAINSQLLVPDTSLTSTSSESDSPRLKFIRQILARLSLITQDHRQLQTSGSTNRVPGFWLLSVVERTRACVEAWLGIERWSELDRLNVTTLSFDLPQARSVLVEQLRGLPAGTWVSAERFLDRMAVIAPRLLFHARVSSPHEEGRPDRANYQTTPYDARQSRWFTEVEAAFVGGALSGPLHWLGLLDVSVDEGRLLAFRINPGGAVALGLEAGSTEDDSGARLVVQPNFQILALGPVSEEVLAHLELFSERVKADRSAFEYLLCRDAVYRAQREGMSAQTICNYLSDHSSAPVPKNVVRSLQEWGEQHERIIFRRDVSLCQATPETLDEIRRDPALQRHLERSLNASVALVRRGRVSALKEGLLQKGILPATVGRDSTFARKVQATPAGELRHVQQGPDLLLETALRGLAEERDGRFFVTEGAVQTALAEGISVAEYLARLETLVHGPLADELKARIKTWGHYYGPASLLRATLLEVKDGPTADELLADPEVGLLVGRLPGNSGSRVLVVRTRDVRRLRRLLQSRGVQVE